MKSAADAFGERVGSSRAYRIDDAYFSRAAVLNDRARPRPSHSARVSGYALVNEKTMGQFTTLTMEFTVFGARQISSFLAE